jgi:peptide chain release factor 1
MIDRLEQMEQRYEELSRAAFGPARGYYRPRKVSEGRQAAARPGSAGDEVSRTEALCAKALAEARAMLTETDPEMRAMAEEEIAQLAPREPALEEEIKSAAAAQGPQ